MPEENLNVSSKYMLKEKKKKIISCAATKAWDRGVFRFSFEGGESPGNKKGPQF